MKVLADCIEQLCLDGTVLDLRVVLPLELTASEADHKIQGLAFSTGNVGYVCKGTLPGGQRVEVHVRPFKSGKGKGGGGGANMEATVNAAVDRAIAAMLAAQSAAAAAGVAREVQPGVSGKAECKASKAQAKAAVAAETASK